MDHCVKEDNLLKWLESVEASQMQQTDQQYVKVLTQYLCEPEKHPYVFLDGRIFQYSITLDHSNSLVSHVINIHITDACQQDNRKHVFRLELRSISDFQHKFIACAGNVILVQFYTEPRKNTFDVLTFMLRLSGNESESVQGVPVISKAYGGVVEDYFYFTDAYRPSVLSLLSIKAHDQKILKACFLKRWVAVAVVRPHQPQLAGIVSEEKGLWENPSPSGTLVTFDVKRECVLNKREDILACAELLKYSHQGDMLITYQKLPSQIYFLDPDNLSTLKVFTYDQYYPFLQLPLRMPTFVDTLQENDTLDYIPTGKVILRDDSIRGLSLVGDKMRFLFPIANRKLGIYSVAHLNLSCIQASTIDTIHNSTRRNKESSSRISVPYNSNKTDTEKPDQNQNHAPCSVNHQLSTNGDYGKTRNGVNNYSGTVPKVVTKTDTNANLIICNSDIDCELYNGNSSTQPRNDNGFQDNSNELRFKMDKIQPETKQNRKVGIDTLKYMVKHEKNHTSQPYNPRQDAANHKEGKKSLEQNNSIDDPANHNQVTRINSRPDLVNDNSLTKQQIGGNDVVSVVNKALSNTPNGKIGMPLEASHLNNAKIGTDSDNQRERLSQNIISRLNKEPISEIATVGIKGDPSDDDSFDAFSIHSIIMNYANRKS